MPGDRVSAIAGGPKHDNVRGGVNHGDRGDAGRALSCAAVARASTTLERSRGVARLRTGLLLPAVADRNDWATDAAGLSQLVKLLDRLHHGCTDVIGATAEPFFAVVELRSRAPAADDDFWLRSVALHALAKMPRAAEATGGK